MACYIFMGAGSAIANTLLHKLSPDDSVYALTRDTQSVQTSKAACQTHVEQIDALDFSRVAQTVSNIQQQNHPCLQIYMCLEHDR